MSLSNRTFLVALLVSCHVLSIYGCLRVSDILNPKSTIDYFNPNAPQSRLWLFAVNGNRKPSIYLDDNGKLTGFTIDFIARVCAIANKRCETILAEFTECTFTSRNINLAGRGLMAGWFDACPAYTLSIDRAGSFDSTLPYISTTSTFTVAPGNPSGFDPDLDDLSRFTLVQLDGAVTNAKCLSRLGKTFGTILLADSLPDAKAKLLNGEADALFSPRTRIPDLEVLPQRFQCDDGGVGVLTKKGSELSSWWNPAFSLFVASGQFAKFCAEASQRYNRSFNCLINTPSNVKATSYEKTWLFAVSGNRKPSNFLDETGRLTGHDVDVIQEVCAIASKKCEPVLTEFTECVFTNDVTNINYAGRGISDGWFDACTGYVDTVDRENNFDFTRPYLRTKATFTVAPGNPSGFDPVSSDYSAFTVVYFTGAYTNKFCLNRIGKKFKKIVIAANLPDAKRILSDREADVLFSPRTDIPGLQTFPQRYQCERTGVAILTRKASPLVEWWNEAFDTFVKSGRYRKQCEESSQKYNFDFDCFTTDEYTSQFFLDITSG